MKWEDFLGRNDIIGGDIQDQEGEFIFRGPIEKIKMEDGFIKIYPRWIAKLTKHSDSKETWKSIDMLFNPLEIDTSKVRPQNISEGRIFFSYPLLGNFTIFPKGDSKLDPKIVEGLTPDQY